MLLRLIPNPTASAPSPPTILFTLPEPTSSTADGLSDPYAPHQLPAPPALSQHARLCAAASLPCQTLLSGESSLWLTTIVKEVTFLPREGEIQVLLSDGSGVVIPLREKEAGLACDQVRDHVLESGRLLQEQRAIAVSPIVTKTAPIARSASSAFSSVKESMFMSLLAPLMGKDSSMVVTPTMRRSISAPAVLPTVPAVLRPCEIAPTARQHRRMARSALVNCYRRWVLTALKELLPPTYLLFTAQSALTAAQKAVRKTTAELRVLLSISGLLASSASTSSDESPSPYTPTHPPASWLPVSLRSTYAAHLGHLAQHQQRVVRLEKLSRRAEREERRNQWENSVECVSRKVARSKRVAGPSPLATSWTAEDAEIANEEDETTAVAAFDLPPLSPTESCWSTLSSSTSDDEEELIFDNSFCDFPVSIISHELAADVDIVPVASKHAAGIEVASYGLGVF